MDPPSPSSCASSSQASMQQSVCGIPHLVTTHPTIPKLTRPAFRWAPRATASASPRPRKPKNPPPERGIPWSTPNGIRTRAATLRVRPTQSGRCTRVVNRPDRQGSRSIRSDESDPFTPSGLPSGLPNSDQATAVLLELIRVLKRLRVRARSPFSLRTPASQLRTVAWTGARTTSRSRVRTSS
jgi:hypothetical protein